MRIFAWSDLHLESKVNLDLVKQFCQLHRKCRESTQNRSSDGHDTPNRNSCDGLAASTQTSAAGEAPVWPPLTGTIAGNIGKLWEVVKKASSPLNENFADDVLILAGDVHHELEGLKDSLKLFCSVFGHVAFVPGNHELWVTQKDRDMGITDSLQKFDSILRVCESLGIHTSPFSPSSKVRLVPLFSWYDEFDPHFRRVVAHSHQPQPVAPPTNQSHPAKANHGVSPFGSSRGISSNLLLSLAENWMDYTACRWPLPLSNNDPKSGAQLSTECSSVGRNGAEASLFRRFSGMSLGKSRRCVCKSTSAPGAPAASALAPAAADDLGRKEPACVPRGTEWASDATCKPLHLWWSGENPGNAPNAVLPSCAPRRFTDAWGMPLSLSEFFAAENERRGFFVSNSKSPCRKGCRRGRNAQSVEARPPVSDMRDYAARARVPGPNIGHTRWPESDNSSHATDSDVGLGSSPEGTPGQESPCPEDPMFVITFSHFLPRAELAKLYPLNPGALAYVMGSTRIDEQLRQAQGSMHVFGHSHVNIDHHIEGVRYVQHSLGRPSEQKWFPARIRPKLIFSDGL
ncbi:hypothetical protein, conserved [Eimeria praecox]|uniref:Calcineurin-like phosphoesterase domain-containing protein n=1 Tax=Eimeria praecox TaxID=51316 RepID=U6G3C2_9EIME|nr:hypothetical protein, conserved [Eimeria praecox]